LGLAVDDFRARQW